jgi:triacylglycerol lipase
MNNPVLLVHGIWDTSHKMKYLADHLREAGKQVFLIDLVPCDGRAGVEELALQIQALVEKEALGKFDIIAFSLGGIISSYYIAELGGAEKVCSFVTISSPHHGTTLAYLNPFVLGKELRPQSTVLVSLAKKMKQLCSGDASLRCLSIRTPYDLMIFPSSSSVISWGENVSYPVIAHPLMVRDARVLKAVLKFIS